MRHPNRLVAAAVIAAALAIPNAVAAQERPAAPQPRTRPPASRPAPAPPAPAEVAPPYVSTQSANETFNELQQILNELPPTVRQVLALDPSLVDRDDYLAPYPRLTAFLQQHPEVSRNRSYFFGRGSGFRERDPKSAAIEALQGVLLGAAIFSGIMFALWMVVSLLRQVIDYRRWLRQSRVQAETSTKVLDRLGSNEDLLAFLQTPAGVSLVQAAPAPESPRMLGMPFGRILWSVQAGVVLAAFGIGLRLVQGRVIDEVGPAFAVAGTIAFCVGIGFVVSAAIAWLLASRLDAFAPRSS